MASSIRTGVAVVVALILIQGHPLAAREVPEPPVPVQPANPTKVVLVNQLHSVLTIHCKFNGQDLGPRDVPALEIWEFNFQPKVDWLNSLSCNFQWPGGVHDFDAYKQTRDAPLAEVSWFVKIFGICRIVDNTEVCSLWN